ncbi:MAG TPA: hypothetical protein PKD09_13505 [Aggregatilinea sp.]|jgi:hypothetical protein|uniref:hypothetical protein n=1 Tax=Aggregatilinea sp. TaxID=2806333 RepID=UPI002C308DCC|nr:hypothetical protein [Aggregatilinea sp.]HML22663.1 hypothetical protein [Aggregatilinea sp.]
MSDNLDELRRRALEEEEVVESYEVYAAPGQAPERIFGMTAAERMFVSIGCFLVVSLSGFLLLLILDKIALP